MELISTCFRRLPLISALSTSLGAYAIYMKRCFFVPVVLIFQSLLSFQTTSTSATNTFTVCQSVSTALSPVVTTLSFDIIKS